MKKFDDLSDRAKIIILAVKLLIAIYAVLMVENVSVLYQGF